MTTFGHMRNLGAAAAVVALAAAGCGGSSNGSSGTGGVAGASKAKVANVARVSTADVSGLGTVLVDSSGRTLYMFEPDGRSRVTCTGACAGVWPPLKLPAGLHAAAAGSANASMLGSDTSPDGGRVVTYAGWPLYTYSGDSSAGQANGQGLNTYGGRWYVLSPAGKTITTKPAMQPPGGSGY